MSNLILYPSPIESAISRLEPLLQERWQDSISRRSMALLLLQKDATVYSQLEGGDYFPEIESISDLDSCVCVDPFDVFILLDVQREAESETSA